MTVALVELTVFSDADRKLRDTIADEQCLGAAARAPVRRAKVADRQRFDVLQDDLDSNNLSQRARP
jgi:hypothetical protein